MSDLVERLRKRAEIRRQISTRKSVIEGKPDRIADLLEEAATEVERLTKECYKMGASTLWAREAIADMDCHIKRLEREVVEAKERVRHLEELARKRSDTINELIKKNDGHSTEVSPGLHVANKSYSVFRCKDCDDTGWAFYGGSGGGLNDAVECHCPAGAKLRPY